jgi:hypothetical protein
MMDIMEKFVEDAQVSRCQLKLAIELIFFSRRRVLQILVLPNCAMKLPKRTKKN